MAHISLLLVPATPPPTQAAPDTVPGVQVGGRAAVPSSLAQHTQGVKSKATGHPGR